jgi:hypothetical protein
VELLLIPSLLAIGLKIAIFMRYHKSLRKENFNLATFFIAVLLLNIVEFIGIKPDFAEQTALLVLVAYYCCYCCVVFVVHGYVNLCLEYSSFKWNLSKIKTGMNLLLALLVVMLIFDREIIAGVEETAISITKIEGNSYWIIQLYLLSFITFGVGLLIQGFRKLHCNLSRQRCFVMLISTFAPVVVTVVVVIAQEFGATFTAAVVLSLAFTLMLGILVYAEEKTRLFRLLTFVPFTKERKLHKQLLDQITDCISINDDPSKESTLNLKVMMKELEGSVVEHVLEYYGGNQKLTASALGVSEATVSRRARAVIKSQQQHSKESELSPNYATDAVRISN